MNVVRKEEHVLMLKDLELNLFAPDKDFMEQLIDALVETGATLGFDATGGGNYRPNKQPWK